MFIFTVHSSQKKLFYLCFCVCTWVHAYAKDTKHLYILEGIAYLDMEEDSYLVFEWLLLYVPSVNRFFFSSVIIIQIASHTIGGKVWILMVCFWPLFCCRNDIGFQENPICRNTVQGRYLLSDDSGKHFPFLSFCLTCYYSHPFFWLNHQKYWDGIFSNTSCSRDSHNNLSPFLCWLWWAKFGNSC